MGLSAWAPRKVYCGVLKHFDAQRKCGYIYSPDAEVWKMGEGQGGGSSVVESRLFLAFICFYYDFLCILC